MSIVINPSVSQVAAPSATTAAPVVLQPGTVISAKVLQVLGNNNVQIAIAGQAINVLSQVPLQAGQTLQLAVSQSGDNVRLQLVTPQDGAAASQAPTAGAAATSDTVTLAPNAAASLAPPSTPTVVAPQLTPQEALAVSVAAQTAASQQASLAPLFANLGVAATLAGLPPQVQQAVALVLSQRTSLDQNLTGADIQQAFQNSGLFLEASLASGSVSASGAGPDLKAALIVLRQVLATSLDGAPLTPAAIAASQTPAAAQPAGSAPAVAAPQGAPATAQQTAATAIVVEQGAASFDQGTSQPVTITLVPQTPATTSPALAPLLASELATSSALPQATAPAGSAVLDLGIAGQIISPPATAADAAARAAVSSAALNLLQEALQAGPLGAANLSRFVLENAATLSLLPAVAGARITGVDEGEFARTNVPPPPISGALPAAQPVMAATLVSNSSAETAMHHLLADTDGALARQTLLQVASLPGQTDPSAGHVDPTVPRWNFEIPFATPQGTAMAQFEISREAGGNEVEAAKRVWRARFSLDVEPTGPIHALVSLNGDKTSVRMWAERPATAAQLRAGVTQLSQALARAELHPGDIVIRDGAPVQTASARAGHFLDRAL